MKAQVIAAAALLLVACGEQQVQFATKVAPDLKKDGVAVSVFGVYKDGRMSVDAWPAVAPRLSIADGPCELAFGEALLTSDRALATAIDDQARAEGPGDSMLELFAPAATGDAILLVTVAGQPPKKKRDGSTAPSVAVPATQTRRGGGRRHHAASPRETDALEVSASLFSVKDKRTVAIVAMTYTGASAEEAMSLFADKLRAELPALRCRPWNHDVKVDPEKVRAAHTE